MKPFSGRKKAGLNVDLLKLRQTANRVRKDIIEAVHAAKSGHPGGSLSVADILTYLYFAEMKIDPANPDMEERDRFVLSKGHATPAYYGVLAERGFFPADDLKTFRHTGSYLQGHPDRKNIPGVDMSSGSLGQGLSVAVGMALSAKLSRRSYRTYALLGDGEIQELDNLVAIIDNNGLQIDGSIEVVCSPYPIAEKFEAFNFHVEKANAHDFSALQRAFDEARRTKGMPTAIILQSVKGKGVSFMENKVSWHGSAPNDEEYRAAMTELEEEGRSLCKD